MISNDNRELRDAAVGVAITAVILLSLFVIHMLFKSKPGSSPAMTSLDKSLEKNETERIAKILDCMDNLQLAKEGFNTAVDKHFYKKYPELNKRKLTKESQDSKYRIEWYNLADKLLKEEAERLGEEKCY